MKKKAARRTKTITAEQVTAIEAAAVAPSIDRESDKIIDQLAFSAASIGAFASTCEDLGRLRDASDLRGLSHLLEDLHQRLIDMLDRLDGPLSDFEKASAR